MKKYRVAYWYKDLSNITGYESATQINEAELMDLIRKAEINVMVFHGEVESFCFIDDRRFQNR